MSYPFVRAKWYSPGAIAEVRALVIHFAEGGNTVHYFQDPRHADGSAIDVSAHFVVQRDGQVVQMVRDEDADHCQHVDFGSWSYPGGLRRANGVAVLGKEMDHVDRTRVNRYVHAIELEGFRDKGMTDAQKESLIALVAERRAKFPSLRGLLGHGDIQNKACPGRLIPWDELGGHGLFTVTPPQEEPLRTSTIDSDAVAGKITVNGPGHWFIRLKDGRLDGPIDETQPQWQGRPAFGPIRLTPDIDGKDTDGPRSAAFLIGTEAAAILQADVTFVPTRPDAVRVKEAVNAAVDHIAAALPAVSTAIDEARIR